LNSYIEETPRTIITKILETPNIEPKIDPTVVHHLQDNQILQLMSLLKLNLQRRDKELLSAFFSSEQVVSTLKEVVSLLYTPLLEMYDTSNM
jgi:hypothetical protein